MRLQFLVLLPWLVAAAPSRQSNPLWYDQGLYGAYPWRDYVSFGLASPRVNVLEESVQCDPGYVFLEPRGRSVSSPGPMILDSDGNLVYMEDRYGEAMDFRPQKYRGDDYLTFWSGTDDGTHGRGSYYMLDSSYEVRYTVSPANGLEGDLHEFEITPNGTALMTIYEIIPADLSSVGGPSDGWIYDGLFQEVDIETGALLFEWRASTHYSVVESFGELKGHGRSREDAWDFFHINSVDKDDQGNYYISSRYMHTITCISPTGAVLWRLGGAHSDFADLSQGAASNFTWQHHVRWHPNNSLTIFDNGAYDNNRHLVTADYSRGLLVQLDTANMTATLLTAFVNPMHILAHSQGSVQILDSGNVFVGWGHSAAYTEFKPDGTVLCDTHFGSSAFFGWGWVKSYRAFKGKWVGQPRTDPDISRRRNQLYVSWNGATEVRKWRLQSATAADAEDDEYVDVEEIRKEGFESTFYLNGALGGYVRVQALDRMGIVLGTSKVMDSKSGSTVSAAVLPSFFPFRSTCYADLSSRSMEFSPPFRTRTSLRSSSFSLFWHS
ncbi:ASST-domain-containing protein [Macrophomina phaseolina]|uniref:ASST-domain-containing protein n=1 Tax=Macrophomina phaseolina TaxID=35725 RepID=A0ABQ8GNC5_9PEZI|nr:ASST-domain-containing protein [Macrophomina phaseolina]